MAPRYVGILLVARLRICGIMLTLNSDSLINVFELGVLFILALGVITNYRSKVWNDLVKFNEYDTVFEMPSGKYLSSMVLWKDAESYSNAKIRDWRNSMYVYIDQDYIYIRPFILYFGMKCARIDKKKVLSEKVGRGNLLWGKRKVFLLENGYQISININIDK